MNEKTQPRDDTHASGGRSAVRVSATAAAIAGAVLLTKSMGDEGSAYFAIGFVLFVSALVAARLPSLFWVPRRTPAPSGSRDDAQVLATDAQRHRR